MKGIKQVKNYRLLREIGKGLTGTVYEAVDDSNGKKFAIKSIPSSKLENKRILENFKKELKLIQMETSFLVFGLIVKNGAKIRKKSGTRDGGRFIGMDRNKSGLINGLLNME